MSKKRPLGQNFLADPGIARRIVDCAEIAPGDTVVEIGPGHGELTEHLLEKAGRLVALELDPRLCAQVRKRFSGDPRFSLEECDALKFDFSQIGPRFKVVSNLPYYAATPILKRLVNYRTRVASMIVMLQKEVADRITASPASRDYGSLTVFIRLYCRVERMLEVKKGSFSPPPKVDSAVIRLTPLASPAVRLASEEAFFKVVHAAFMHKRKTLKNNLTQWRKWFTLDRDKMAMAGVDLSRRGETLSLEEFALLANAIHEHHD